jgi:hypothetical protein
MHTFIRKVVRFKFPAQNSNLRGSVNQAFHYVATKYHVNTPLVHRANYRINVSIQG